MWRGLLTRAVPIEHARVGNPRHIQEAFPVFADARPFGKAIWAFKLITSPDPIH
jgi:hypothetical protein